MNKSIHSKKYQIYIRAESEFNVQADLYAKLRNALSEFGFQIFGEVRLMGEEKIGGARRQKGRLDLAIFYKSKIICAIEVKNKKIKGINRQIRLYEKLGVSKLFVCVGKGEIDHTVKCCKKFCKDWITPKLTLKRNKLAQGKNKQGAQCSLPYFKDNLQDDEYQKCRNCGGELVFKSHQQITEKQFPSGYFAKIVMRYFLMRRIKFLRTESR